MSGGRVVGKRPGLVITGHRTAGKTMETIGVSMADAGSKTRGRGRNRTRRRRSSSIRASIAPNHVPPKLLNQPQRSTYCPIAPPNRITMLHARSAKTMREASLGGKTSRARSATNAPASSMMVSLVPDVTVRTMTRRRTMQAKLG